MLELRLCWIDSP